MVQSLRRTADFQRVRERSAFRRGVYCGVSAARQPGAPAPAVVTQESRFGLVASKRVGGAVQRNRARRLVREAVRSLAESIGKGWDVVVVAQPAISRPGTSMGDVRSDLRALLRKAGVIDDDAD